MTKEGGQQESKPSEGRVAWMPSPMEDPDAPETGCARDMIAPGREGKEKRKRKTND